jgi:xanthine dehydrogenase accessory factor
VQIIVLGSGDVGSAVAHRLFRNGLRTILVDVPAPAGSRRGMAFTDAFFDGEATLEGVVARLTSLDGLAALLERGIEIPAVAAVDPEHPGAAADVLIDARMRKRTTPTLLRGRAPLVIGLGPGFVAGSNVDVAIETSWSAPGRIVRAGPTLPLSGEPRDLGGHGRDRYVAAPASGRFVTGMAIGDRVRQGEPVAAIGNLVLAAPLDGILRGLTRDGVHVQREAKVIEVDPRGRPEDARGIGERPGAIADGVLAAVLEWAGPS